MSLSLRCSSFFLLPPTCTRGDWLSQRPWTQEEDDTVRRLVAEQRGVDGANRWAEIAKYLPGRNGKQCRERWHNQLDPAIRKDAWTAEEDATLIAKQVCTCLAHTHLGALGGAAMRHAHERAISIIARACTLFGLSPRASRARAAAMCRRPTNTASTASDSPATPPLHTLFTPPDIFIYRSP